MNLTLHNSEDADVICKMLTAYEEKIEKENINIADSEKAIIRKLRTLSDNFVIRNSFDFIGELQCIRCDKKWTAIISYKSNKLECPRCHMMNDLNILKVK